MKKNVASQYVGCQLLSLIDGTPITTGTTTIYVTGDNGTQAAGSVSSGACTHKGNGYWSYAPAQAETNYDHVAFTFKNTLAVSTMVQVYPSFPQTGDSFARIGAPAGASLAADILVIDDLLDTEVAAIKADTAAILIDTAEIGTAGAGLTALATAANLSTVAGYLDTEIAAILADTNELQTDWANGGRLDLILDTAAAGGGLDAAGVRAAVGLASANLDTQLDAIPTAIENADALLNRDMATGTDSGSPSVRTVRQALRFLRNKWSIATNTLTVTKEDDTTASWTATVTTDAAAVPIIGNDPA